MRKYYEEKVKSQIWSPGSSIMPRSKQERLRNLSNYYEDKLNSQDLFRVYDTAIPRIEQYLRAEIEFVKKDLKKDHHVLEVAAGYGRIMRELAPYCGTIVGMDISAENVALGKRYLKDFPNSSMIEMNSHKMTFDDSTFDIVLCMQNALSIMRANNSVIEKMVKLLAPGGILYISSYSAKFWDWRLKWFEEQADKGLLGKIDYKETKDGVIVCNDGFRAAAHSLEDLQEIGDMIGLAYRIEEVDESSIFLIIQK